MPDVSEGQTVAYVVVVNRKGQYSIWPADKDPPRGWALADKRGAKSECLSHIDEVWKDMRPISLRLMNEVLSARGK
jgi:MbtH protein